MGWLFSSRWESQKEVEKHLVDQLTHSGQVVLDKSSCWGEFYALLERNGERFIFVALIEGTKASRRKCAEFGYKDMTESCGPCYYNCPERLLAKSTDMSEYAVAWREKCRTVRKEKTLQAKLLKSLKQGDKVMTMFGELIFDYHWKTTQFVATNIEKNKQFRYNVKHLEVAV